MNTTNYIRIFRGDDSDALGYQTIVGTIKTDLDLTGCKAVFRFLGFYTEFNPIPEDGKLTIVIPAQASRGFPPGVGYASLRVFDSLGKIRTFTNRIPVIVDTMTPSCAGGEFEVSFSPFPELEPLKIFIGPNADDFDQYTGFLSKIIDRASLAKYGLVVLADAMSEDGGASGKAASPLAVKAAYDAIIKELTDNYYTADETDEAIDRVAAYYITYDAAGNPFPTYAALANATTVYSGGQVRVPTRNDYCVVLADETHQGAEYRYIYAVAEGQTTGSWQPQFPVEGVMTVDQTVTKDSQNPVSGGGVWSAIWGALASLPAGFSSLYDWCVSQLAGKEPMLQPNLFLGSTIKTVSAIVKNGSLLYPIGIPTSNITVNKQPLSSDVKLTGADIAVSGPDPTNIDTALAGKASKADATLTPVYGEWVCNPAKVLYGDPSQPTEVAVAAYKPDGADVWALSDLGNAAAHSTTFMSSRPYDPAATSLTFTINSSFIITRTVTATRDVVGYRLGPDEQTNPNRDKPLASEAEAEALRTGKLDKSGGTFGATTISLSDEGIVVSDTQSSNLTLLSSSYNFLTHRDGLGVRYFAAPSTSGTLALIADIPYDRITITTGQLQDHAVQKVTLNAATTTLTLPALTTGKVSDFGIDVVNGYEVSGTPTAASFTLDGTLGSDYNLIVPEGEDWSEMSALAAGKMAVYYFTLSAFQINDKPTWEVMKKVVELVPVPSAP